MGFTVEVPGLLTTIQDEGRFCWERFGMSPSGPMDLISFRTANILVGNPLGEAALEATMAGPTLLFDAECVIALTGADMRPSINGISSQMYRALKVKAGDLLTLGTAQNGCRTYIAFSGGLDAPVVMGSMATALQNHVGGLGNKGLKLKKGDRIAIKKTEKNLLDSNLASLEGRFISPPEPIGKERTIRVILGPQDDAFTKEGLETFLTQPYAVSQNFDRMGYRLDGAVIEHKTDGNIISDGIVMGAIQVPTSGLPIIMMAERQTVGGYTKIATVISADLPIVGQSRAGDIFKFKAITIKEAHDIWRNLNNDLQRLKHSLEKPEKLYSTWHNYRITVNGRPYQVKITRM